MPAVLRQEGFAIEIYADDHEPAHVHIWKAGVEVVINLGVAPAIPAIRGINGMKKTKYEKPIASSKRTLPICAKAGGNIMAKIKLGISEEEFERQFAEAKKRGQERLRTEPRAKSASYHAQTRRVLIELRNGCTLLVPVDLLQGLRGASDKDLADFSLMPRGFDLHWHKLDAQFTVDGLLKGLFGTKKWMAELNQPVRKPFTAAARRPTRSAQAAAANKRSRSAA